MPCSATVLQLLSVVANDTLTNASKTICNKHCCVVGDDDVAVKVDDEVVHKVRYRCTNLVMV